MPNILQNSRNLSIAVTCILAFIFEPAQGQVSQTVTEIITNYNTYWKSGSTSINPVKPSNSHSLLAFTFNGMRYSTGVNDELLISHGDGLFIPGVFKALPFTTLSGIPVASTKVALGQLYDGVHNGASVPAPPNNFSLYLTDGINGLDIGTGIANLPTGELDFGISNILPANIGDGIPDILITQIADPSTGVDQYRFVNALNATVGNPVDISFTGINHVGNWTADFYEARNNPMTLFTSFTNVNRPIRLWAADFSYFGITLSNYTSIESFKIQLNGNSDLAFIAYNTTSLLLLPVQLSYFRATVSGNNVKLFWQTQSESNSKHFVVEKSTDGQNFTELATIAANGNSTMSKNYSFVDNDVKAGSYYFRLKQVDVDGRFIYSQTLEETIKGSDRISIYPNPASKFVIVSHVDAQAEDQITLYSAAGLKLISKIISAGSIQTQFALSSYPKGSYIFQLSNKSVIKEAVKFIIE